MFLAVVLSAWVSGRAMLNVSDIDGRNERSKASAHKPIAIAQNQNRQIPLGTPIIKMGTQAISGTAYRPSHASKLNFLSPVALPWATGGQPSGLSLPPWVAAAENPVSKRGTTPRSFTPERKAGTTFSTALTTEQSDGQSAKTPRRLSVYGYSFWRDAASPAYLALAPSPQYGASQSGVIVTWYPIGAPSKGPALLIRTSATPNGREREIALGVRWKPDHSVPLSITLERRFGANAEDRFAAHISGGVDEIKIMGRLSLDAFGQAGAVSGENGGGFFDGQGRVMARIATIKHTPISIGAGSWTGGQRGSSRLDVGPTVASSVRLGDARFRLQLDWRFRVAGKALPGNGPALTISGGF
jgi:hypothetical protein